MVESIIELTNKAAIAQTANIYAFVITVLLSLSAQVVAKIATMAWFRHKTVLVNKVAWYFVPRKENVEQNREESFKKAGHRHKDANDKKRYEFRVYYEELGESVATMVAFGVLIMNGTLEPAEGFARLAFALFAETLADVGVWKILECDGYYIANVVYRFSIRRVGAVVAFVVAGLTMIEVGHGLVVISAVKAAVNETAKNSTLVR